MIVNTATGVLLDTEGGFAESGQRYANEKGVDVRVFLATHPDGTKAYVLVHPTKRQVIYETQSFEALGVHIDIMALGENTKETT